MQIRALRGIPAHRPGRFGCIYALNLRGFYRRLPSNQQGDPPREPRGAARRRARERVRPGRAHLSVGTRWVLMKSSDPRASRPRQLHAFMQAGRSRAGVPRQQPAWHRAAEPAASLSAHRGDGRPTPFSPHKDYNPQHAVRAGATHAGICGFLGSPAHARAAGRRHAGGEGRVPGGAAQTRAAVRGRRGRHGAVQAKGAAPQIGVAGEAGAAAARGHGGVAAARGHCGPPAAALGGEPGLSAWIVKTPQSSSSVLH